MCAASMVLTRERPIGDLRPMSNMPITMLEIGRMLIETL